MKETIKYALCALAGAVVAVSARAGLKGISKSRNKKSIKTDLAEMGLDKYNTEGKKIALGAVNKGVATGYVKIKDLDEVNNLSKAELEAVRELIAKIQEKEAPAEEEQPTAENA